jgi:hypothetical protein
MARRVHRQKPTRVVEHDFVCHECGIDLAMLPGMRLVVHEPGCKTAEQAAIRREDLKARLDKAAEGGRMARGERQDALRKGEYPKGHREALIITGHHNPRNPDDWCYKWICECGEEDLAWSYEDAVESRREHRAEFRIAKPKVAEVEYDEELEETVEWAETDESGAVY